MPFFSFSLSAQTYNHLNKWSKVALIYLFCYFSHWLDTCSIKMIIVLASFNEFVILNILLHLFSRSDKMVITSIHLIISFWSSSIFKYKVVFKAKQKTVTFFSLQYPRSLPFILQSCHKEIDNIKKGVWNLNIILNLLSQQKVDAY